MKTFRAFIMNDDGNFIAAHVLDEVETDEQAVEAARMFAYKNAIEVWQGDRRIAELAKGGEIRHYRDAPARRPDI
ncbi:hypothetical protein [Flaviflagellibacter deserti]|uniref:Uncharacterized protein n=1 Tax=Flaviflagellibacter deserti TaxID=2267266 RepID=A0ABV9Z2X3_9HYPH